MISYIFNTWTGTINPAGGSHYYYGQNRLHARFPWEERELAAELTKIKEIAEEHRSSVRERWCRESGYTGLSILNCLYKLYGFDVIKDMVFDIMHNLPLNIVGNYFKDLIAEKNLMLRWQMKDLQSSLGQQVKLFCFFLLLLLFILFCLIML